MKIYEARLLRDNLYFVKGELSELTWNKEIVIRVDGELRDAVVCTRTGGGAAVELR